MRSDLQDRVLAYLERFPIRQSGSRVRLPDSSGKVVDVTYIVDDLIKKGICARIRAKYSARSGRTYIIKCGVEYS